jgi:hypothetical protein
MNPIFRNFFLFLSVFLFSCQSNGDLGKSKKERIVDEIIHNSFIKISKKTELVPCGTGAQMMDEIKMLGLYFDCKKQINIDEARKLLIDAADEFLNEINSNEEVRPYLSKYPFEIKNVEICIYTPPNQKLAELAVVSVSNGFLIYKIDDIFTGKFEVVVKETYEEGLQKLHSKAS